MKNSVFAAAAAGGLAVSLACGAVAAQAPASAEELFDESDVVLTFSDMSDSHIGFQSSDDQLRNALKVTKEFAANGVDALLFCGDQTQDGIEEQAKLFVSIIGEEFDMTQTPVIVTHGNHDTYWSGCMTTQEFAAAYGSEMYTFDEADTDYTTGNRHVVVNGYHFLSVQIQSYTGRNNTNPVSAATEQWLRDMLNKLTQDDPNRYIFVSCHCPAPDTVYGSFAHEDTGPWGSSKELNEILKEYPQVVLFSGHTHYALNDERSINQSTYTQVQSGSTSDADVEKGFLETGTGGYANRRAESQGLLVEVDGSGRVRITRIDYARGKQIKGYWYLDACSADGSHLNRYTKEARSAANTAPAFADGAELSVKELSDSEIEITYPAAQDDDMVYSYTIEVKNASGETAVSEQSLSPWYGDPALVNLPASRKVTLDFSIRYPYTVTVTANDSFGLSDALTVEMVDTTEQDKAQAAVLDGRVAALAGRPLQESDGDEIRAIRAEIGGMSYKAIGFMEEYDTFLQLEGEYYNTYYLAADAAQYAPAVSDMWSIAPTEARGHAEASPYTGVRLVWESANTNSSLGFSEAFRLDGLHLCFANLNITSEDELFGIVIADAPETRWLNGECFLLTIDFATGAITVNGGASVGTSAYLLSGVLGATPFELVFEGGADGSYALIVHTLFGDERFAIGAEQFEGIPALTQTESCYVAFSPWARRMSASVDVVAAHGGEDACMADSDPAPGGDEDPDPAPGGDEDPETPETPEEGCAGCGTISFGGWGGGLALGAIAVAVFASAFVRRTKEE